MTKHFQSAFKVVQELNRTNTALFQGPSGFPEQTNTLQKLERRAFSARLVAELPQDFDLGTELSFVVEVNGYRLTTDRGSLIGRGFEWAQGSGGHSATVRIDHFSCGEALDPSTCSRRMLIPIPAKTLTSVYRHVAQTGYETEAHSIVGRIPLVLKEGQLELIVHHHEEEHYLIIDGLVPFELNEFLRIAHDVTLSLGFVTAELAANECFCFEYSDLCMDQWSMFTYHPLRDSMRSSYPPVHENPYTYLHNEPDVAQRYYGTLRPLSIPEFTSLCQRVLDSAAFAAHVLLVQESMASSLVAMPPGLCVALEGLCRMATAQKKVRMKASGSPRPTESGPDHMKDLLDRWLPGGRDSLEKLRNKENMVAVDLLKKKLNNIGAPTNRTQLEAPFADLGFALNDEDLKAIDARNSFLHGAVMLGKETADEANREAFYMAMRLYCLVVVLILKPTGYDSRIVNYPRINEQAYGLRADEAHFRQI